MMKKTTEFHQTPAVKTSSKSDHFEFVCKTAGLAEPKKKI